VVDIPNTNVVLGIQWIYYIGKYIIDQRTMEMGFTGSDGKKVVLRSMHKYPANIMSTQNMEEIMRHGDIGWATECFIYEKEPPDHL
jgi:hypothetical protein